MHAIRQYEFGPPETLRYEAVPDPEPAQTKFASPWKRRGCTCSTQPYGKALGRPLPVPDLPMTPGREVAGVVDAVGPGVDTSWVGRRVVAHLGQASGGYAERAVVAVASLHELGDDVAATAAVAMIGTGRTTVAILDAAALTSDDVVLVTAAAGGIGVSCWYKRRATWVPSWWVPPAVVRKVAIAMGQGATFAVDYSAEGWTEAVRDGLDGRALDGGVRRCGRSFGRGAFDLLGPGGRFVLYGFSSGEPTPLSAVDLFGRGLTATGAIGGRASCSRRAGCAASRTARWPRWRQVSCIPCRRSVRAGQGRRCPPCPRTRETVGKTVLVP